MARRRKTTNADLGLILGIIILIVLAITASILLIPTLIAWGMYRMYERIPEGAKGKGLCLFSMIVTGGILYGGGILILKSILIDKTFVLKDVNSYMPLIKGLGFSFPFIITFIFGVNKSTEHGKGIQAYENELERAVSDKISDDSEIKKLSGMIQQYEIPDEVLKEKHHDVYMNALWATADDLKIDEEELKMLDRLSQSLGITDSILEYTKEFTDKINRVHKIINGELEGIEPPVDIILKKNETCYLCEKCELFENVKDGFFVGTSIKLGSIPILNPRLYLGKKIGYESMKKLDAGIMVITDKRVVFSGDVYDREFAFSKILGIDAGYDGIQIKHSGKAKKEVFKIGSLNKEIVVALIGALTKNTA